MRLGEIIKRTNQEWRDARMQKGWVTLEDGQHVLFGGNGEVISGMGNPSDWESETPATSEVNFTILHNVSHSKGWGRFSVTHESGNKFVQSSTGNEWVSANHSGTGKEGDKLKATLQTQTTSKSGKKLTSTEDYHLVVAHGHSVELGYWSGLHVRVENAKLIGQP